MMRQDTTTAMERLRARLRAVNPVPPSYDHLFDPDLLRRLTITDVGGGDDDSVEDAEPKRKRRPTLAARPATLPPTLPPRLISRDAAAAYVGVSPNTFDKMIADGLMPNPRQLTERRLAWDVRQLDAAIDRLLVDGGAGTDTDTTTDHSWDDIDAQAKTKSPVHRKAAGRRLAEAGCSTKQIMAVLGHKSLAEAERYTKEADQIRLATAAMSILEAQTENEIYPNRPFQFGHEAKKSGDTM